MTYRKVETRMFADERFRALSRPQPNAQTLWGYLLYGPNTCNVPGLLHVGVAALAEELDWSLAATEPVLDEILASGMAKFDRSARLIYLPNALRHNMPESPNVVRGWRRAWSELPECALKREAEAAFEVTLGQLGQTGAFLEAFREITGKTTPKASGKSSLKTKANQEQEQEQEPVAAAAVSTRGDDGFAEFWSAYPKRVGKDAARRAWQKRKPGVELRTEIAKAIAQQMRSEQWTREGGRFIPNPATWLNEGRWQDEGRVSSSADCPTEGRRVVPGVDETTRYLRELRELDATGRPA